MAALAKKKGVLAVAGLQARSASAVAHVRHLLAQGYERDSARHFVADEMTQVLTRWGVRRRLGDDA